MVNRHLSVETLPRDVWLLVHITGFFLAGGRVLASSDVRRRGALPTSLQTTIIAVYVMCLVQPTFSCTVPRLANHAVLVTSLLKKAKQTRLEPEHLALHKRWTNLVKMCSKHNRTALWANSELSLLLILDHPA